MRQAVELLAVLCEQGRDLAVSVVDDPAATTSTTSYFYKNPRHGTVDDDPRFSFRGFEEVTTTAPSGAKTIQHYDYGTDGSGRQRRWIAADPARPLWRRATASSAVSSRPSATCAS